MQHLLRWRDEATFCLAVSGQVQRSRPTTLLLVPPSPRSGAFPSWNVARDGVGPAAAEQQAKRNCLGDTPMVVFAAHAE
jgi:hypothetical protein